jgi:hypothetical protein
MRININCESSRLAIAASGFREVPANEKDLSGCIVKESAPSSLAIIDAIEVLVIHRARLPCH